MSKLIDYIEATFGANEELLLASLHSSPSSRGYVLGAVSEVLLRRYLEENGYEVLRIAEKPAGGNRAKNPLARGDFYVRTQGDTGGWLVVECKGLKSNSEFRGGKLDSKEKVLRFLEPLAFPKKDHKRDTYKKGQVAYKRARTKWKKKNKGKRFPPFAWDRDSPGPISCDLKGVWADRKALRDWVSSLPADRFKEQAYRQRKGAVAILETHKPNPRVGPITGISQAAPLVTEFGVLAVDLFLRTGNHEFAFVNPVCIAHSPTSPEHLYQNYTIDILVPGLKQKATIQRPWYEDISSCIAETKPDFRELDPTQLDERSG